MWVLLIALITYQRSTQFDVRSVDFGSEQACIAAANTLAKNLKSFNDPSGFADFRVICVRKN